MTTYLLPICAQYFFKIKMAASLHAGSPSAQAIGLSHIKDLYVSYSTSYVCSVALVLPPTAPHNQIHLHLYSVYNVIHV